MIIHEVSLPLHILLVHEILKKPNYLRRLTLTVDDITIHQTQPMKRAAKWCSVRRLAGANRLTLHHFASHQLGVLIPNIAPHNSDAQDTRKWPAVIVNLRVIYAAAVMNAWSPKLLSNMSGISRAMLIIPKGKIKMKIKTRCSCLKPLLNAFVARSRNSQRRR